LRELTSLDSVSTKPSVSNTSLVVTDKSVWSVIPILLPEVLALCTFVLVLSLTPDNDVTTLSSILRLPVRRLSLFQTHRAFQTAQLSNNIGLVDERVCPYFFAMFSKVMNAQQRRFFFRPRVALYATLAILLLYVCMLRGEGVRRQAWKQAVDFSNTIGTTIIETISPADEGSKAPRPATKPPPLDEQGLLQEFKQEWEELGR
jgi:hypothetical protein